MSSVSGASGTRHSCSNRQRHANARSRFQAFDCNPEFEPAQLRDLSLDEVELQLENFRISVNGILLDASTRVGGGISGAALWFLRAGEVADRSLSFVEGNDGYEISSTSRIAPAGGRFNLYVLRDSNWRPPAGDADLPLIVGAAARAEWLAAK